MLDEEHEQTIDAERDETRGRFTVTRLYPADYAALMNLHEAPAGKGWKTEG